MIFKLKEKEWNPLIKIFIYPSNTMLGVIKKKEKKRNRIKLNIIFF